MAVSSIISSLSIKHFVSECLKEDQNNFEYSTFIFGEDEGTADIVMNDQGVVTGISFLNAIFKEMGCTIKWHVKEGQCICEVPKVLAVINGPRKEIYRTKYLAMNILSRASGISTLAKRMRGKVESLNWNGTLTGTTKFTPGFSLVEKYAMLVGGIDSGRYDPSSLLILDSNHTFLGTISEAVAAARKASSHAKVAVLCKSPKEAENAASSEPDVLLLDSFEPYLIASTCKQLKSKYPKMIMEVCGSVAENNLSAIALPQVDVISCSRLCQDYTPINVDLKFTHSMPESAVQSISPAQNGTPLSVAPTKDAAEVAKSSNLKRPASSSCGATTSSTTDKTEPSDSTPEKKSKVETVSPASAASTKPSVSTVLKSALKTTPSNTQSANKVTPPSAKPGSANASSYRPPIRPSNNQNKMSPLNNSASRSNTNTPQGRFSPNSSNGSQQKRNYYNPAQNPQQKSFNNRVGNQDHRFPGGPQNVSSPRGPVQSNTAVGLVRMVAANLGLNLSQPMGNNSQRPGAPFRPPPFATNTPPGSLLSGPNRGAGPHGQRPPLIPGGGMSNQQNRMLGHNRGQPRFQGDGGRPGPPRW